MALPSGADPRTEQRKLNAKRLFLVVLRAGGARLLVAVAASWPGALVPLAFGFWFFSFSLAPVSGDVPRNVRFRLVAAGVTFQLPAGGTSSQTHGHRPKYRLFQVFPFYAVFFNLGLAYRHMSAWLLSSSLSPTFSSSL